MSAIIYRFGDFRRREKPKQPQRARPSRTGSADATQTLKFVLAVMAGFVLVTGKRRKMR